MDSFSSPYQSVWGSFKLLARTIQQGAPLFPTERETGAIITFKPHGFSFIEIIIKAEVTNKLLDLQSEYNFSGSIVG